MLQSDYLDSLREQALEAYKNEREPFVVEALSRYFVFRPEDAYAWFVYGDCLRFIGRFKEAEAALNRALSDSPPDAQAEVFLRLGMLYDSQCQRNRAEECFTQALEDWHEPDVGYVWVMRGANLASMGEFRRAEECHRRALNDEEVADEAYLNLGYVLRAQGRYDEARAAFAKAAELDLDSAKAHRALKSLDDIERAIELDRNIPEYEV